MAIADSFLSRTITDFRENADEPSINAKYTDARLITKIEQAYSEIISEVNRNRTEPIVAKFNVTYTTSTAITLHLLPYFIGSIHAIYREGVSGGDYKVFYHSRSRLNPIGRQVWVEGHTLKIQPRILATGDILTIEYVPTGTARLHNGTCTVDTAGIVVTFGASPDTGVLDTHANAYAGMVFRLISDTDADYSFMQERTITAYNPITRKATLDIALSPNPGDGVHSGTTSYEIAPSIHYGLDFTVGLYLAHWITTIEGSITRSRLLRDLYRRAIRNLRLTAYYSNIMEASKVRSDNYDLRNKSRTYRLNRPY